MSDESVRGQVSAPNWRSILFAVCVAQATAIVGFDFTLPFIPLYLQHGLGIHGLGQTALWAGIIGFGPAIPATLCGPLWGRLADRFGYRAMLLRAVICAAILLCLMGFAVSPWMLLALRMIQGGLTGTVYSAQALVAASVPKDETAKSMGLLQMSVYVGATMGPIGGGAVAQTLGFRAAFWAAGLLLAGSALVVYLFVHEPGNRVSRQVALERGRPTMLSLLTVPAFFGALAMTLVVQLAGTSVLPVIPLFVEELLHSSAGVATDTGWVMAGSGLAAALGSYVAGRVHRHIGLKPLLLTSLTLSAVFLVPQSMSAGFTEFLVFRCLAACAYGSLFSLVSTWAAISSPPHAKGAAFGLVGAASSLGFGGGPLLGGFLAASIGIRPLFLLSAAGLGLMVLGLLAGSAVLRAVSRSGHLRRVPAQAGIYRR